MSVAREQLQWSPNEAKVIGYSMSSCKSLEPWSDYCKQVIISNWDLNSRDHINLLSGFSELSGLYHWACCHVLLIPTTVKFFNSLKRKPNIYQIPYSFDMSITLTEIQNVHNIFPVSRQCIAWWIFISSSQDIARYITGGRFFHTSSLYVVW